MINDTKRNPSPELDAAASIAQPIALMTAGAMFGVAMAMQTFGLWMQSTSTMLEAMRRVGEAPDTVVREGLVEPADVDRNWSSLTREPEAQAGESFKPRKNVAPMRNMNTGAKRAKAGPVRQDDLKAIAGIGPKLEQVLNGAGIHTYAQLGALSADEIASLEARLGLEGRIGRDDWTKRASALAAGYLPDGSEIGRRGASRREELV